VLAVLLLERNRVVSVDRLADEVWGERPPPSVRASILNCVSRLRRVLGAEAIETRPPGYRLRVEADSLDAARFEGAVSAASGLGPRERAAALAEALALWRGPALADVADEPFARVESARLDELRLVAQELRLEAMLELGQHASVLPAIEALVSRYPDRERLRYLQMLALYRAGRQRDALDAFQEIRRALVDQFGLEPSVELRALQGMILAQDQALGLPTFAPARTRTPISVVVDVSGNEDAAAAAELLEQHGGAIVQVGTRRVAAAFDLPGSDLDAVRALAAADRLRDVRTRRVAVDRAVVTADPTLGAILESASPGDVVVGEALLPLIAHAVEVVPLPHGAAYRVLQLDRNADALPRRFDTPFVGREQELDLLAASFNGVRERGAPELRVVVGEAGIGKTRLANEFLARVTRRAKVASGRCVAGESASELVASLASSLGFPDAETLAGQPDAARVRQVLERQRAVGPGDELWALRRLLEAAASEIGLVVAVDDLHRAEPTTLDLVDYIVGWASAPILFIALGRPEVLDDRPEWRASAVLLEPLRTLHVEQLATALPESNRVVPARRAAAVHAAEGNPLFLEQLIGWAADEQSATLPPTLDLLIDSRLETLPPQERALLERAAIIGEEFSRSLVEATTLEEERGAVARGLLALVRRRLLRAATPAIPGEDGFRFTHGLIRDVTYEHIAVDERASLHLLVARALESAPVTDDALIGEHLERAAGLGPDIASAAGHRLGIAGFGAFTRGDWSVAIDLLTRALSLLKPGTRKLELEGARAAALKFAGHSEAESLLEDVAVRAERANAAVVRLRARVEQVWPRLARRAMTVEEALEMLETAITGLEAEGDDLGLGRAWDVVGVVNGAYRWSSLAEAAEIRALHHYQRCGFTLGPLGVRRAAAAYLGMQPVPLAIETCSTLLADSASPLWESFILPFRAALYSMDARFAEARNDLATAREGRAEFADPNSLATSWALLAAEVELRAGSIDVAERILAASLSTLRATKDAEWLATNTALSAEAAAARGDGAHALALALEALDLAPKGHLTSEVRARRARVKALVLVGRGDEAFACGAEALAALQGAEAPNELGETLTAVAAAALMVGKPAAAAAYREEAARQFAQKRNRVALARLGISPSALVD
jgi:DNA-binding SARP family transcriptional activator